MERRKLQPNTLQTAYTPGSEHQTRIDMSVGWLAAAGSASKQGTHFRAIVVIRVVQKLLLDKMLMLAQSCEGRSQVGHG